MNSSEPDFARSVSAVDVKIASFAHRVAARVFDLFLVASLAYAVNVGIWKLPPRVLTQGHMDGLMQVFTFQLVMFGGIFTYEILVSTLIPRSVGKLLVDISVVDSRYGLRPQFSQALARSTAICVGFFVIHVMNFLVLGGPVYFRPSGIALAWSVCLLPLVGALFRQRRQGIHDTLARTIVVTG